MRPVISGLAKAGVPVSVDTMRAEVAQAALEVGARLVNDVSGGLADPEMARLVAQAGVPYVVMHWRHKYVWPAYNVADAALVVGVILLILVLGRRPEPAAQTKSRARARGSR